MSAKWGSATDCKASPRSCRPSRRYAWLDAEYAAGVREIEVSSFVPPKLLPQLADAEAVVRHALTLPGLHRLGADPQPQGG